MPLIQPFFDEFNFSDQREDEENTSLFRPTIDERNAGLCWSLIETGPPNISFEWHNFKVIDYRAHIEGSLSFYEFGAWCMSEYKSGASTKEWLMNERFNCYGVFLQAIDEGRMPSGNGFRDVLVQFSKIKQCEWARTMLTILRTGN